ncbi:MAG: hypothetical protein R6U32_00940 [Candidatus Woesearchaeota archaeon]
METKMSSITVIEDAPLGIDRFFKSLRRKKHEKPASFEEAVDKHFDTNKYREFVVEYSLPNGKEYSFLEEAKHLLLIPYRMISYREFYRKGKKA